MQKVLHDNFPLRVDNIFQRGDKSPRRTSASAHKISIHFEGDHNDDKSLSTVASVSTKPVG